MIGAPSPSGQFFTLADLGLPLSQADYLQIWLTSMQATFPGYNPVAGDPMYAAATVGASWAAAVAQMCSAGATELWRQYGLQQLGQPYQQGTPAQAIISVTAVDTAGYTLNAGSQLTLTLNGVQVGFQTATSLTIPNGQTTGQVTVLSLTSGSQANSAGSPVALVSQTDWVASTTLVTSASNGVDQQDDDQYVAQLAQDTQLLGEATATAPNFATRALNFIPDPSTDEEEVGRATAIDGYDPLTSEGGYQPSANNTGTFNNEREVTACITDLSGNALNTDTMTAVGVYLQQFREAGFIINVVPPSYSTIYVAVTVVPAAGVAASTVQANVQSALLNYLTPTNFGLPPGALTGWQNTPTVYLSAVSSVVQNTTGVQAVVSGSLAVDLHSNPSNTSNDLLLPGPFPLALSSLSSIPLDAITVS